jgi:hypothetical protein
MQQKNESLNKSMAFKLVPSILKHLKADTKIVYFVCRITILPGVRGSVVCTYAYSSYPAHIFLIYHFLQEFPIAKIVNEQKQLRRCVAAD